MGDRLDGPSVILETGLWSTCLDWCKVQPAVAEFAQVYSYDHAGFGWSDSAGGECARDDIVEQLHALLTAADVPRP
jgi:pimeloyl-ACP methyl ester carboxylesterase